MYVTPRDKSILTDVFESTWKDEKLEFDCVADRDFLKDRREEVQNEVFKEKQSSKGK